MSVFTLLHCCAKTVGCVEDFVHEALGHGLLATLARVTDEPAQCEGGAAVRLDLNRNLVGRATDTAGANLEGRLDVVECTLERGDGISAGLLAAAFEGAVDDALCGRALAIKKNLVDQLCDERRREDRIDNDRALGSGTLARH